MAGLDDFMSWLMGGTQLGNFLGVTSPTASTQTPALPATAAASPVAPTLGGQPLPSQGLLSGLLGGQQPANPMSYFMPRQGLLGNSPLGMGLRGGLAGLAQGAGYGGLTGLGMGAMGGQQEELQRRQQQMQSALGGQQFLQGQQQLVTGNINNQLALESINLQRQHFGMPPLTMADLVANPALAATPMPGQTVGTTAPITTPATTIAPATGGGTVTVPGTTYSTPGTQRTLPSGSTAMLPGQQTTIPSVSLAQLKQGFSNLEGGVDKVSGAIGGLTQGTFNQFAKPGESFDDPAARAAVTDRVIASLAAQSGGDPAKIAQGDYSGVDPARLAVGWFSGPGNIAPPGAVVPWNYDAKDAHGTTTSGYVANFAKQLGQMPAQQQQPAVATAATGQTQQPAAAAPQAAGDPAVVAAYQNAIDTAYMTRDYGKAAELEAKLAEYQAAAGHAAQTTAATQATTYAGPQAQYDRAQKILGDYNSQDAIKIYRQAKPAADAFNTAYAARGTAQQPGPNYPGDYALVVNALKAINPDAASPKPGTMISATDLPTLPAQLQKQILALWNNDTALPADAAAQLAKAVQNQMKSYESEQQTVTQNFRERALTDAPQVPETYWHTDFTPPTPPDAAIKFLKANPKTAKQFDIKYGLGLAQQYLGS